MAWFISGFLPSFPGDTSELLSEMRIDPHLKTEDAMLAILQKGSRSLSSPPISQLRATSSWITLSKEFGHPRTLEMYSLMLQHLDLAVACGSSLDIRRQQLSDDAECMQARGLVSEAVAVAIQQGAIETAVEFFERGRSILLAQFSLYRTSSGLEAVTPDLSQKFDHLSCLVECATFTEGLGLDGTDMAHPFEDPISRSDRLRREWERVIEDIRAIEGFEGFLRPTSFVDLQNATTEGPVILINISNLRSDAIIVISQRPPVVVPLPSATPEHVESLVGLFKGVSKNTATSNARDSLRTLWDELVEPIVLALESAPDVPERSRIWWCPTGAVTTLPLHAAGVYHGRQGKRVPDLYISSYTPTLSALSRARQGRSKHLGSPPKVLLVGQLHTPGQSALPAVADEIARVKARIPNSTVIMDESGTCDAVLSAIGQHKWIHLACHGNIKPNNPLESHFALHNGPVSLLELIQNRLPDAELAFLSCCHSASGQSAIPDEFLHLAAGMQFAGFKSVIGTMWVMNDAVGPKLADEFYRVLLGKKGKGDYRNSAKALNDALKVLRLDKVPAEIWINFVHWGA